MKKILLTALVLVMVAAVVALVWVKRPGSYHARGAELAPAETVFFAHLPDLRRSADRWQETALNAIWNEPDMQAFLEKPKARLPAMSQWLTRLEQLKRTSPGEAFVAVTSIDASNPRYVGGFSFRGRRGDVEALIAEPREELRKAWPAGKSDIISYNAAEIETFQYQEKVVAQTFRDGWFLVANDLELLQATLDRLDGKGAPSLATTDIFKSATQPLPADSDGVFFAQLTTLTDRLGSLLVASGQKTSPQQLDDLKRTQAISFSTKMEGTQIRDTFFALHPDATTEPKLPLNTLALSAPETLLYSATAVPASLEIPESAAALTMFIPGWTLWEKALATRGVKLADFGKAFGPELGSLLDWSAQAMQPSILLALEVRDRTLAQAFADTFTDGQSGGPAWGRKEEGATTTYQMPTQGMGTALGVVGSPTMVLTEKFLVIGFSQEAVAAGLQRLTLETAGTARIPGLQEARNSVAAPSSGFAYLDVKALFERTYAMFRPFIVMSVAFSGDSGKYIDTGKLPATETISRHLGPSAFSQVVLENGTLAESVGTLTLSQVVVAAVGGGVAAAFPMIEEAISGGFKLDSSSLAPAFATPPSATPKLPDSPPSDPSAAAELTPPEVPAPSVEPLPPATAEKP